MTDKEKLFLSEQYSTLLLSTKGPSANITSTLVSLLVEPANKDFREETLQLIKKEPAAAELLIEAITDSKYKSKKGALLVACWESCIDCSKHLELFVQIVIDESYIVALEAETVVENMEGPFTKEQLEKSRKKLSLALKEKESDKQGLLKILEETLKKF